MTGCGRPCFHTPNSFPRPLQLIAGASAKPSVTISDCTLEKANYNFYCYTIVTTIPGKAVKLGEGSTVLSRLAVSAALHTNLTRSPRAATTLLCRVLHQELEEFSLFMNLLCSCGSAAQDPSMEAKSSIVSPLPRPRVFSLVKHTQKV